MSSRRSPTSSAHCGLLPGCGDREQVPLAWDTLELSVAALAEIAPRAGPEIPDCSRDDHLTRPGLRRDTRADVDGDPANLAFDLLALPCVEPGPNLEAEVLHRVDDRAGTADRARRSVERGEEAVTGGVELLPAEPHELSPHQRVVLGEQVAPTAVAELDQFRRRADDVGEENGREHAVGLDDVPLATIPHLAEKTLGMLSDLVRANPPAVLCPGESYELRSGDMARDVLAPAELH